MHTMALDATEDYRDTLTEGPGRRLVAQVHGENYAANARLITAAPDLLTACRCALADLEAAYSREDWDDDDNPAALTIRQLQAAIAIAKAEPSIPTLDADSSKTPPRVAVFGFYTDNDELTIDFVDCHDEPEKILRGCGRPEDWKYGTQYTANELRELADNMDAETQEEIQECLDRIRRCFADPTEDS